MPPPKRPPPPPDSVAGRRRQHRQHLAALFADIPPKRRREFMMRASKVLTKILEESDPDDTKFDDKGRAVRFGTSKRDRAAIVKDALSSFKLLGEISRDATEQHIAVTKLMVGILTPQDKRGGDETVPLEDLSTLKMTVEHNECPPSTAPNSSDGASKTSDDSAD